MKEQKTYVYIIQELQSGNLKVGFSTTPEKRLETLQTANPRKLTLTHKLEGIIETEREIQGILYPYKLRGEWFRPPKEVLDKIINLFKFETEVNYIRKNEIQSIKPEEREENYIDTNKTKTLSFRVKEPIYFSFKGLCTRNNTTVKNALTKVVNTLIKAERQEIGEKLIEIVTNKNDQNQNLLDL